MGTKNPKKTIASSKPSAYYNSQNARRTWSRRNGSGNIGSLLDHNSISSSNSSYFPSDDEEPRRPTIFSKTKPPVCIHRPTCRSCYCQKAPIKPLLNCDKPEPCCASPNTQAKKYQYPYYVKTLKSAPKITPRADSAIFTNQRQNYENHSSDYFVEIKCELEKVKRDLRELQKDNNNNNKVENLQKFRNQHFFECHSNGFEDRTTVDHICVHRFIVDDALRVKPKKADVYGQSRCTICNKPMSNPNLNLLQSSRNYLIDDEIINKSVDDVDLVQSCDDLLIKSRIPKRYCFTSCSCRSGDTDKDFKKIRKCNNNREVVEIQMSKNALNDDKLEKIRRKKCRNLPVNSMALRFQKGVYG